MTYDTVIACVGLLGLVVCFISQFARMERRSRSESEHLEALVRAARPPMPPEPPLREYAPGSVLMVSKGRETYGQVIESVALGHRVPTMPRPSPAARCQWCRVKLTNGECVDGCGGHQ